MSVFVIARVVREQPPTSISDQYDFEVIGGPVEGGNNDEPEGRRTKRRSHATRKVGDGHTHSFQASAHTSLSSHEINMESVSLSAAEKIIDDVCSKSLKFWKDHDIVLKRSQDTGHAVATYFSIELLSPSNDKSDAAHISFYLSYTTWDGRMVYLDRFQPPSIVSGATSEVLEKAMLQTLSLIATGLNCVRVTWRDMTIPSWYTAEAEPHKPETLHGWLTIAMDKEAMVEFAGISDEDKDISSNTSEIIEACILEAQKTRASGGNDISVRPATAADVGSIERFVRKLAVYEKEPEAVHVTKDNYKVDGYPVGLSDGLEFFRCLMLEKSIDGTKEPIGIAMFYLGNQEEFGKLLYLEDLFIEEEHRRGGSGTHVMKILAKCAHALGCNRFLWQALDWNTPALNFYSKIGAKVQNGVITSRYAGEALQSLASSVE